MSERMWRVLDALRQIYTEQGIGAYLAIWQIQKIVGFDLEGCGCPGDPAITLLLKMGLIEEVPELNHRYWIKITT